MIDEKKLINYIKGQINPYGKPFTDTAYEFGLKVMNYIENMKKVGEWIPADEPPKDDNYILLSFENYSLPLVGRYDPDGEMSGAYYIGDCDGEDTCTANDLFVNAWQPLPEPYRTGGVNHEE